MDTTLFYTDIIYLDNAATVFPKPAEVLDKALADAEADGEAGNGGVDLLAMVDSLTLLPRR